MRYKLILSYLGKNYNGFQIQNKGNTIQLELEKALSVVFNENIKICASGRTDAGVSALGQVAHFDCNKLLKNVDKRVNLILPDDIRIINCECVDESFHSRFSAKKKTYLYNFYMSENAIPYLDQFCLQIKQKLDIIKMQLACDKLIGTKNFKCFSASNTEVSDYVRTIYTAKIIKNDLFYSLEICGSGFLYNMVRIIMGTLISVGLGKINDSDIINIIRNEDRKNAGVTVKPIGLVLKNVEYV